MTWMSCLLQLSATLGDVTVFTAALAPKWTLRLELLWTSPASILTENPEGPGTCWPGKPGLGRLTDARPHIGSSPSAGCGILLCQLRVPSLRHLLARQWVWEESSSGLEEEAWNQGTWLWALFSSFQTAPRSPSSA